MGQCGLFDVPGRLVCQRRLERTSFKLQALTRGRRQVPHVGLVQSLSLPLQWLQPRGHPSMAGQCDCRAGLQQRGKPNFSSPNGVGLVWTFFRHKN